MALWVLWMVGIYTGLRSLSFFLARMFHYPISWNHSRLVLMTENNQHSIEWVIRSFLIWQQIHGREAEVICVDTGSTDDTKKILSILQHRYPALEIRFSSKDWLSQPSLAGQGSTVVDLRRKA